MSRRGGNGVKGVEGKIVILACCEFHFLENMKFWCKIQVILYPLLRLTTISHQISMFHPGLNRIVNVQKNTVV